jgi:hypothetical protein
MGRLLAHQFSKIVFSTQPSTAYMDMKPGKISSSWLTNITAYGEAAGALLSIRNHQNKSKVQNSRNPTKKGLSKKTALMLPWSLMEKEIFERAGFNYEGVKGKNHCIMRKTI